MPVYRITSPDGNAYEVTAPEGATEQDVLSYAQQNYSSASAATPEDPYANDSAWDFSGERTLGGRILEGNKAVARGFGNTILGSVEGAAELVDAATNFVGLDNLIDSGDENAAVWAANAGKDWLNNKSGVKVDPRYQDLWTTKFGEGVGSMASFFTPTAVLKGASVLNRGRVALEGAETIGKLTRAEKIATGAFAASSGAGEAAQRAKAAREEGLDVSEGQEDFATAQGAVVGLTEMLPISRILGRVPKNIPKGEKDYLLNLFKSAGIAAAEEGTQEVSAAILQNMIERGYNPNQEIIEGSLMDDLTIGASVGALADITLNAFAGRRKGYMTEAQKENERKAREIEARNDFQFRQEMAERKRVGELIRTDPEAFNAEAERVQGSASSIPAPTNEEVMAFNQPSSAGAVATPETLGELYSLRIVGKLGSYFPTNTSFTVEQGEDVPTPAVGPDGTETVVPQPSFKVVDSTGKQYGQTLTNPDVASSLARNLNGEIVGQSIRGSILGTLMTSPQGYNPEQATNLFRYGFQTLNPESNNVTYAALNDAAGTTTENGYIEEVSHNDILNSPKILVKGGAGKTAYQVTMPNGKKRLAVGLTASQELNRKREAAGLPPVNSFNIRQAREALGGNIGTLGNPSVTGIQDQLQYSPANVGGKPAVVNEANEVLTKRKTTLAEKAKAGFKQDGTSVLPDYIEFQSMDDAKRYADSLNKRNADKRFIPDALFEGKKDLFPQIKALLEAKNIDAEMDSDEVGQLVKSFTGARDAKSMTLEDQKLFYARLRNLPGFSTKTKLPVFRLRPYSPEQFVKATQYQNQNPGAVTDEGLATALGLDPASPKIAAIKSDLQKQTDARLQKELLKDSRLPLVERLRKALDDYGLSSVTLRLEETLQEANGDNPEGYFERQLGEIALAIDGMDTELNATDEQRLNYLKEVLSHEVVHALRALDLWTAKEWDILTQAAERTIHPETGETFAARARRMYADMSVETQIEESIAELARAYIANKKLIGGKPRNLLERMIRLFQRLKAFVTNSGYQSFEAILNDMRSGAIGARDRGEIRSLRLTKNVPEGYVVADNVPEGVEARTVQDFDEVALEGAEVMQSRKDAVYAIVNNTTGKEVGYAKTREGARRVMDRRDDAIGGYRHSIVPINERVAEEQRQAKLAETEGRRYSRKEIPATIDVDGVQRPTTNSNGQQIDDTEEKIRNFWKWFGNSRMVDEQGRPKVYYHGTKNNFDAFKGMSLVEKVKKYFRVMSSERGGDLREILRAKQFGTHFFTDNPDLASDYALMRDTRLDVDNTPNVLPVYLKLERPVIIDLHGQRDGTITLPNGNQQYVEHGGLKNWLFANRFGYSLAETHKADGFISRNVFDAVNPADEKGPGDYEIIVTFDPKQSKSSISNTGAYSSKDNRLRYSRKDTGTSKDWAYSPLMKAVEQASPKITTAQQWSQWLDANAPKLGVTKDEIDFSGIKDFLALKDGKVSKEDINGYLDNNGVVVKDVMKESNEEEMADFIDSYVRDESSGIKNGYSIVFPDGTMGVYGDPGIFFEGHTPEVMAEKLGIELPDKEIKYQSFTIPGGENYRELLLTLPFREPFMPKGYEVTEMVYDDGSVRYFANTPNTRSSAYKSREEAVTELMRMVEGLKDFRAKLVSYDSSHWNEPNILAHIRMDDRVDQNGDKVLFIEEIQSDWAQEGRETGFEEKVVPTGEITIERDGNAYVVVNNGVAVWAGVSEQKANEELTRQKARGLQSVPDKIGLPTAPFVTKTKNWVALALKRILALAENEGYKKVAFINGQQSAERYDLRKQIEKIDAKKNIAGTYLLDVEFKKKQGERYAKTDTVLAKDEKELQDYVGKDLAQKIVKDLNPEINLNRLSVEQNEDFETFSVYSGDFKVSPNFPSLDDARDARDSLRAGIAEPTFPRGSKMYTGIDLAVGGEGMLAFYDSIVPQVAKEVIKKVGGKNLSEVYVQDLGRHIGIEITPEMSERIAAGQVLFSRKDIPNTFDRSNIDLSKFSAARQAIPEFIDVDGVQRPTTNSNGQPIFVGNDTYTAEEGIRNFWKGFNNSVIVDSEGRPRPVYHATRKSFDAFGENFRELGWHFGAVPAQGEDRVRNPLRNQQMSIGLAMTVYGIPKEKQTEFWNSLSQEEKDGFEEKVRMSYDEFLRGANVMPVYLRMEKPLYFPKDIGDWNDVGYLALYLAEGNVYKMPGRLNIFKQKEFDRFKTSDDVRKALIEKGYDGIIYQNDFEGKNSADREAYIIFDANQIKSSLGNIGSFSRETDNMLYSRKDMQGIPRIPFEVAPSPDNKERTAAWRAVPHAEKVRITQTLGQKAVREASKILGIDSAAFEPMISGQGLFEGHVNPNQILGIREQFLNPDEVLEFASVLGRILEQKAMIAADGRMTGRETSVIRIQTKVGSLKVADRIYAALTAELGDLGGYTAYKNHIDVFNFTDTDSETLAKRFTEIINTNAPDINSRVSHDTIQSAYLEEESYGDYLRRKKSANQERLERGIESARSRIIGELETAISRAGQRSDGQPRVRRQGSADGRPSDALGGSGRARSLQEVKGPEWLPVPEVEGAESIPAFAQRKVQKDAVSAFAIHYSQMQGLMALDSAFAGSGSAGGERRRFGMGVYGKKLPPGDTGRRLYFYAQSKSGIPQKEDVVAGSSVYRVRLDNLYDVIKDPLNLKKQAGVNPDLFEELVNDAGYDGAVYPEQPGIDEPVVILFGLSDKVPVRPYSEQVEETPVAPISEEEAAEAVAKAKKDTELTPKTAIPLYGENASPDALFVAQNPEKGAKLGDKGKKKYSRRGNEPTYSPAAQVLIDQTPQAPNETMGETLVKTMKLGPLRDGVDIFRQAIVFKGARLERQYKENPELARLMADSSALTAYEMMDHSRSMTQAALTNGVPVYVNGGFKVVPFVHKGKTIERGFLEVMAPLNNDKLHGNLERLAHRYAMAVRGERLNAEGKLTPVAPGELAILKAEIQKYRNPETGRPVIEEWYEMWQDYNSYIVKFLRDTGVVDESGAELWLKQADYVPFYREDNQGNLVHPKVFGGLHTASQFKSVGKSSEDLNIDMVTAIVNNIDAAIAMGMKNVAQQRVIRDQIGLGLASILKKGETVGDRNSVSFKIAGKRYTAIIEDPLIYQSMLPSNEIGMDNLFGKMLRIPASILRELIIRDPGYMVANMFRDTLSTYVTTGAEVVPLWGTAKGFAGDIQKLRNLGVLGGYDLRLDKFGVRKFYDKEAKRMGMVAGLNWINPISTAWDLMGRISERSEAATRLAVYEDVLKRTGNQVEAQYQALSVMNYGRRGNNALFRALTAVVPFLNARVQGLDKLYQAGTGRVGAQYKTDAAGNVIPDAQRRKNFARFVYRAGLITAVSAMYYAMVSDDDEYLNASPEIRDNYYILPIMKGDIESGKPGLSARLPIPFEVGILFKVIPERLIAGIYGDDTSKDFKDSMRRALVSTLGINPTPQAVLPIAEMLVNKDFYSGRPIVPTYMENLLPEQQTTFYTNQLAESVANSIGASPMKVQHLMQGYGGTLGGYFLQAVDSMARENEMVLPSTQWFQKPFIKRFFTTANQPGLQNKFYELKDDVDGITQTINRLQKEGRYDELAAFYAQNGHMYEMRTDLNYLEKQITMLRDQRKVIEQMDIPPESKREAIEQINMMISATLVSVPMYREMAYDKQ